MYGWLAPPEDLMDPKDAEWDDPALPVVCFGDDFAGDFSAFLPTEGWTIAELSHDSGVLRRTYKQFPEYIREQMLMGPGGIELRSR